jgi:peptidoglycan/LPS O-acetylase OafA/YrhL
VLATGLGSALLLVYAVGRAFARPRWRWLAVGAAVVAGIAHERVLDQGYPGLHFLMVAAATTLSASALAGGLRPASAPRRRRLRRGLLAVGLLALAALAVGSLTLRPPNAVRLEMFRVDGAVLAHELGRHDTGRPVTARSRFRPRSNRGSRPGRTPNRRRRPSPRCCPPGQAWCCS